MGSANSDQPPHTSSKPADSGTATGNGFSIPDVDLESSLSGQDGVETTGSIRPRGLRKETHFESSRFALLKRKYSLFAAVVVSLILRCGFSAISRTRSAAISGKVPRLLADSSPREENQKDEAFEAAVVQDCLDLEEQYPDNRHLVAAFGHTLQSHTELSEGAAVESIEMFLRSGSPSPEGSAYYNLQPSGGALQEFLSPSSSLYYNLPLSGGSDHGPHLGATNDHYNLYSTDGTDAVPATLLEGLNAAGTSSADNAEILRRLRTSGWQTNHGQLLPGYRDGTPSSQNAENSIADSESYAATSLATPGSGSVAMEIIDGSHSASILATDADATTAELGTLQMPSNLLEALEWAESQSGVSAQQANSHPYYSTPLYVSDGSIPKFSLAVLAGPHDKRTSLPVILWRCHELLQLQTWTSDEAAQAVKYAELLVQSALYWLAPERTEYRGSRGELWRLGRLYLVSDTLLAIASVMPVEMQINEWWPAFIRPLFTIPEQRIAAPRTDQGRFQTRTLYACIFGLKFSSSGRRLPARVVIGLKKALLCDPLRHPLFNGDVWADLKLPTETYGEISQPRQRTMQASGGTEADGSKALVEGVEDLEYSAAAWEGQSGAEKHVRSDDQSLLEGISRSLSRRLQRERRRQASHPYERRKRTESSTKTDTVAADSGEPCPSTSSGFVHLPSQSQDQAEPETDRDEFEASADLPIQKALIEGEILKILRNVVPVETTEEEAQQHPFFRTPDVSQVTSTMSLADAERRIQPGPTKLALTLRDLKQILGLQRLNNIDAKVAIELAATLKVQAQRTLVKPPDSTEKSRDALWRRIQAFLAFDVLLALCELFPSEMRPNLWWDSFADSIIHEPQRPQRFRSIVNAPVLDALQLVCKLYKLRIRPSARVVVGLTRLIFSRDLGTRPFRGSVWEWWRSCSSILPKAPSTSNQQ